MEETIEVKENSNPKIDGEKPLVYELVTHGRKRG